MLDGMFAKEAAEVAKKLGYNADSVGCELIRKALLAAYENGKAFQQSMQPTPSKRGDSASSRDRKSKVVLPAKSG